MVGAEGSARAKRGWACIGLALEYSNDSKTAQRWVLGGLGVKERSGVQWACIRLLKLLKERVEGAERSRLEGPCGVWRVRPGRICKAERGSACAN